MNFRKRLRDRYGLTECEYEAILERQHNLCGLCHQPFEPPKTFFDNPCVDHCHVTGNVRGILHRKCNSMLGLSGDSVEMLLLGARYLEERR